MMKKCLVYLALGGALIWGALAGLAIGPASIPLPKIVSFALGNHYVLTPFELLILAQVRLPRVLVAVFVGAALAVAGGVMQGLFRNPLASPYTLGLAAGASAGAAVVITLGLSRGTLWALPGGAFLGAGCATGAVVLISRTHRPLTLILAGIALSTLFSAVTSTLIYFANPEEMGAILVWTMGGLGRAVSLYLWIVWPPVVTGILVVLLFSRTLDLLALGDEQATHMGVSPARTRWILLSAATAMTAAAVACVGPIGFVGLIVPHALRLVIGPQHLGLLFGCALGGAGFLVWADLGARTLIAPAELPVGIITAFLGVPFFLYLLRRGVSE